MDVLVLGANGLLGSNVVRAARLRGLTVAGTYHSAEPAFDVPLERLDVRDPDRMRSIFETHRPDTVVNCAALTDVDGCESNPEAARAVNSEAPGEMAQLCSEFGSWFVHASTDYVFNGERAASYSETDEPDPLQVYGSSKLAGERAVRDSAADTVVARLSFVYGIHRSTGALTGFPEWVRARLMASEETPLFVDQQVTPSRAGQVAETFLDIVDAGRMGTVHVATRSCVTPYELGDLIRRAIDAPEDLLLKASMNDVDQVADRPAHTCLAVDRVESWLGRPQPTLAEDLLGIKSVFE